MQPQDRDQLIKTGFQFVSWLKKNFPIVKDNLIHNSIYRSYGELVRTTPTLFWGDVGDRSYEELTLVSAHGESILDRVIMIVKGSSPAVQNEILVGFVEAHMFTRPDSALAKDMGKALGRSFDGLC